LNNVIPVDHNKPYDMMLVIQAVADRNEFYSMMPNYAKNIITGFIEVEGKSVGIVAN
jgi:acetyl-CoA carboxylase carboxyltransferase component